MPVALARDLGGAVQRRLERRGRCDGAAPARASGRGTPRCRPPRPARAAASLSRPSCAQLRQGGHRDGDARLHVEDAGARGPVAVDPVGNRSACRGPHRVEVPEDQDAAPAASRHRRPRRRRVPRTAGSRPRRPVRAADRGPSGRARRRARHPPTGSPGRRGPRGPPRAAPCAPRSATSQSRALISPLPRSGFPWRCGLVGGRLGVPARTREVFLLGLAQEGEGPLRLQLRARHEHRVQDGHRRRVGARKASRRRSGPGDTRRSSARSASCRCP